MLSGADIIDGLNVQCTELVPAVAAGVIQWARTHWPAEKICESVELCDAAMLSSSQVMLQFTYLVICSALQHVWKAAHSQSRKRPTQCCSDMQDSMQLQQQRA